MFDLAWLRASACISDSKNCTVIFADLLLISGSLFLLCLLIYLILFRMTPMPSYKVRKDPQAELDYGFEWDDWLAEGDYITTSVWVVTGPDAALITQAGSINPDQEGVDSQTMVWLLGGTPGKRYTVTNSISTFGGRKDDRSFTVSVFNK